MPQKLTKKQKRELKKQQSLLEVTDTCVNCGEHIALDQRFCSYCGGKRIYNRLTWRNLIEDFLNRFFNLENSFFKTFIAMFRKPEDVIGGYMNGMRKKYLPAFSYFAIAITFTGFYYFLLKNWFMDNILSMQNSNLYGGSVQEEVQLEISQEITNWFMENISLYMVLLIPFFAILSRIVFWNYKQYNLVEHLVIFLYTYSHISIVSVILQISVIWSPTLMSYLGVGVTFLIFIYSIYVLKRLFKLDMGATILKTLLFLVVLSVFSCFLSLPFVMLGVKSMIDHKNGKEVDESSFMGKFLKLSIEQAEADKKRDSLKKDSLKRLENTLEITPEMIKNASQ